MRKKLLNTKVTVKLRKSEYKEEWYLIVEAYPVNDPLNPKRKRIVESIHPFGISHLSLALHQMETINIALRGMQTE